jgi:hypothetical protein
LESLPALEGYLELAALSVLLLALAALPTVRAALSLLLPETRAVLQLAALSA